MEFDWSVIWPAMPALLEGAKGKRHRQRKIDKHHLHHDRGAANDFDKHQCDVIGDPATVSAGKARYQADEEAANQSNN